MRAGTLRHRVRLLGRTETPNAFNEVVATYAPVEDRWASVSPIVASEQRMGDQIAAVVTHEVRLRMPVTIRPTTRIEHRGRQLEIVGALNVDERRREVIVNCREVVEGATP